MTWSNTPIARIGTLELTHFKGFHGSHAIDLDADIVLVAGPNGYGKSSLIEAIALLLTGWYDERLGHVSQLVSRRPNEGDQAEDSPSEPEDSACLKAEVRLTEQDSGSDERSVQWRTTRSAKSETETDWSIEHTGLPKSPLSPDEESQPPRRVLESKLCAFFQDRLDRLFDETAKGETLRDILEPRPDWVAWGVEQARAAIDRIADADRSQERWTGTEQSTLSSKLENALVRLTPLYLDLVGSAADGWPRLPARFDSDERLSAFAVQVIQTQSGSTPAAADDNLPQAFSDALIGPDGEIARQLRNLKGGKGDASREIVERIRELAEKRLRLIRERKDLKDRFPQLIEELAYFSADDANHPDALAIFRALAANARRWSERGHRMDTATAKRFAEVLEQFAQVVPEAAGKCGESIESWLVPRQDAMTRLRQIETEVASTDREIERLRRLTDASRLESLRRDLRGALDDLVGHWKEERARLDFERRVAQRALARTYLASARSVAQWLADTLDELTAPDAEIQARLARIVTWVMERFSTVPGLLPVRLTTEDQPVENDKQRRCYRVLTADGRELVQLSTGQRAQLGVALMVAQNREVGHKLSHRILLLDDVSTAYDLSNLTREALLWRQLAYSDHPAIRRQIFISSHHEDMTNQLLDLLVPPPGHSLRLLRFEDWSPEQGPTIAPFGAEPTGPADQDGANVRALVTDIEHERYLWKIVEEDSACPKH